MFTSVSDPTIQVHIPATVTTLGFTGGGSLGLSNNGTLGTITDTTKGMDHTITIAAGTTESDVVVLSTTSTDIVKVIGQADAAGKMDIVKFDATVDVNLLSNYIKSESITTGAISFSGIDVHETIVVPNKTNTLGGTLTMGVASESATTGGDTVGWTYEVNSSSVNYLAKGASFVESFTVTVKDENGNQTSKLITVEVTGTGSVAGPMIKATSTSDSLLDNLPSVTSSDLVKLTVGSATAIVSDVEAVHFADAKVLIVGAGGYASLTEASKAATGGEVIYVADKTLADGVNGVINHSDISIYIANGDGASMKLADNLVTTGEGVRIYGNHSFTLTGTSGADTIHDYTNLTAGLTNNILGMDGADNLVSHSNDLGTHILTGGSGADILVGGKGAQLLGGDGDDKLLAFGGAALLSGGAGNDVLLNAYGSADGTSTVNMIGGSGSDTFGLISSTDTSQSGTMRTVVTDLGTGDKVDLSFVESVAGRTINTVSDFTGTGGKATMTTSGTTLAFGKDTVVTNTDDSSPALQDVDSHVAAGTMILSNATLTKASTAINAADITSVVDFNNTFGHLTDTYNHHG